MFLCKHEFCFLGRHSIALLKLTFSSVKIFINAGHINSGFFLRLSLCNTNVDRCEADYVLMLEAQPC